MPAVSIALLAIAIALHSSLQHEALHGHPTRWAAANEALVCLPIGLVFPYGRYKRLHLRHHADERLTDPYDDPESFYLALGKWDKLPSGLRTLLHWNNTLAMRVLVGPAIMIAGLIPSELRVAAASRDARKAWRRHLIGLAPTLAIVVLVFRMPIWAYLIAVYFGVALLSIRSFCEHQWAEHPDERTAIIEASMFGLLFLNNNLHLVHHKHPTAAWYELPELYRARRHEWRQMNNGYIFASYFDVFRRFALRPKEPVVHPNYLLNR